MRRLCCFVVALGLGCGDNTLDTLNIEAECQPLLAGADCMLPYPSDFFVGADGRIALPAVAKPRKPNEQSVDILENWDVDGFSQVPNIVAFLPDSVVEDGLVGLLDDPARSVETSSPTLIVEAETGRLIQHYVDLDPDFDPKRRAILIHPREVLRPQTRYVVVLHGVASEFGIAQPAEGFRRIRDDEDFAGELGGLRERFERDIFPVVESAGVERAAVQLAWDFTTSSASSARQDMLRVRDLTLSWLGQNQPTLTIDSVEDEPSEGIWRLVRGRINGPLFMSEDSTAGVLFRESGDVAQNGSADIVFTMMVPNALQSSPGRLLAFGHGFFGSSREIATSRAVGLANRLGVALFSIEWLGMSRDDLTSLLIALTDDPAGAIQFSDRVHQAIANWLVVTEAMRAAAQTEPSLLNEGSPIINTTDIDFIGVSQGHILGGVMTALNPGIRRVVLHVGGAGFAHMMYRSTSFGAMLEIIAAALPERLTQHKYIALAQSALSRIDPAIYADLLTSPDSPPILMQAGLADASVPNLGTFLHARSLGLGLTAPSPSSVPGFERVAAPHEGSALAVFDFGVDLAGAYQPIQAGVGNPVHDELRSSEEALSQIDVFLDSPTPSIIDPCAGEACILALPEE